MSLTADARDFYAANGYVIIDNLLTLKEIEELKERVDGMLDGRYPTEHFHAGPASEESPDDPGRLIKQVVNKTLPINDPVLRRFAEHPALLAVAREVLGCDDPMVFQQQALVKEPGCPNGTAWHQDNGYWQMSVPAFTAWFPLEPVRQGGGSLAVIPGSNRGELLEHLPVDGISRFHTCRHCVNDADAIEVIPALGSVSFHDKMTVHGAFPNQGSRRRIAVAQHYAPAATARAMKPSA